MPSPSDLDQLLAEGLAFRDRGASPTRHGRRSTDPVTHAHEPNIVLGDGAGAAPVVQYITAPAEAPPSGPRATSSLQAAWIDPEETPFTPVLKPGNTIASRIFSLFVMAIFLGVLGWLIIPEVSFRIRTADTVTLSDGILTAQAVPLAPIRPALVDEVFVSAAALRDGVLPAGTPR